MNPWACGMWLGLLEREVALRITYPLTLMAYPFASILILRLDSFSGGRSTAQLFRSIELSSRTLTLHNTALVIYSVTN